MWAECLTSTAKERIEDNNITITVTQAIWQRQSHWIIVSCIIAVSIRWCDVWLICYVLITSGGIWLKLHYAILYYTILCYTLQFCTVLYCTVLCYSTLHYIILSYVILSYPVPYCLMLSYHILFHTVISCLMLCHPILSCLILSYPNLSCRVLYNVAQYSATAREERTL